MSLGVMMSGGNPASGERQEDDFYPTPAEVTIALFREFQFPDQIWDCAAGDGAILKVAQQHGYRVFGTDINPRNVKIPAGDFLKMSVAPCPTIITNPPFNLAEKFIRKSFGLGVTDLALVLKSTFFHAKCRKQLFDEFPPAYVCPLLWRPDFLNLGRPTMECSWYIWNTDGQETRYRPLAKPV